MTIGGQKPTCVGAPPGWSGALPWGLRDVGTRRPSLTWDGRAVIGARIAARSRLSENLAPCIEVRTSTLPHEG